MAASTPAGADFAAGVQAYDSGDYEAAFKAWKPLAEKDDPAAQRNIGHLYRFGLGVGPDFAMAAYWYREAAEMGLAGAQANLGTLHLRGQGVPEDMERAAYWFEKAARQGHAVSQYNLGLLYLRGQGVARHEARAMGWFHLAAKAGHPQALEALSRLVTNARPTVGASTPPPKPPQAPLAAKQAKATPAEAKAPPDWEAAALAPPPSGNGEASYEISSLFQLLSNAAEGNFSVDLDARKAIKAKPPGNSGPSASLEETTAAAKDSAEFAPVPDTFRRTSDHRRNMSEAMLAFHAGDYGTAKVRLEPLAEAGMIEAQYQLGLLHRRPAYAKRDPAEAYAWLQLAAERGHPDAETAQLGLFEQMSMAERLRGSALLKARRGAP